MKSDLYFAGGTGAVKIDNAEELPVTEALPANIQVILEIARQVDALHLALSSDLIFKAAVQACFGKMEW